MSKDRPLELVSCPRCGQVASIEWRSAMHGNVYLKIRCVARHWFLMPAEDVTSYASVTRYTLADQVTR